VLINPFGGGGVAPSRWKKLHALVKPAGLTLEVIDTTHASHARELMATLPIDDYHAICTVSGDGLVYEVINGLLSRDDGREAVQKLPLSPAPGGTGNGLFASICHKAGEPIDIIGAAFLLVKGKPTPLDLWEYVRPATAEVAEHRLGWSMLSLSWGIISDVDLESEVLRWAGPLRLTLYALWRISFLRRYSATLKYLDAASDEWKTLDSSNWVGLWACNVPYMTETDFAAPGAGFDDGCVDIMCLVGTSRWQALSMFLAMEEGKHIGGGGLEVLKAKAFRLDPKPRTPSKPGLFSCDGEQIELGPIEARAHPAALRVLA